MEGYRVKDNYKLRKNGSGKSWDYNKATETL